MGLESKMDSDMHVERNSLVERLRAVGAKIFLFVSAKLASAFSENEIILMLTYES